MEDEKNWNEKIAKRVCNLITQVGFRLAKKYKCKVTELGITTGQVANLAILCEKGLISFAAASFEFEYVVKKFKRG